jgi:hypothetical protein
MAIRFDIVNRCIQTVYRRQHGLITATGYLWSGVFYRAFVCEEPITLCGLNYVSLSRSNFLFFNIG